MANPWGGSWGGSWGDSWGTEAGPVSTAGPVVYSDPVLALVARPYDPTIETTLDFPPVPVGEFDIGGEDDFTYAGGEAPVYAADTSYISHAGDMPPHTHFPPALRSPFEFNVRLWDGDRPAGRSKPGLGNIDIENGDGRYDAVLDHGWDGRPIELWRGERRAAFSSFALKFRGTAAGRSRDENTLRLFLRDQQGVLDKPLQGAFYGGGGGPEGDEAVAGKPRPVALGRCENVPAALVDANALLYQLSFRSIQAVDAVRDKGAAVMPAAVPDYPTATALLAATQGPGQDIDEGEYATCLAVGCLRLGSAPEGQLTVDLEGDDTGGYVETTGALVRRIVTGFLGLDNFADPGGLDTAAFADFESAQPAPVGIWIGPDETPTVGEIIDALLGGAGAWSVVTLTGRFTLGILAVPALPADDTLTNADIVGTVLIEKTGRIPPWAFRVGYRRMFAVQEADGLAGSIQLSAELRRLYSTQYRYARSVATTTQTKHKLSDEIVVDGYFTDQADAAVEAARLRTLHSVDRGFYTAQVQRDAFEIDPGAIIDATGVSAIGKVCVLAGIRANLATDEVTWTLWG
jgi:hypothetical protein